MQVEEIIWRVEKRERKEFEQTEKRRKGLAGCNGFQTAVHGTLESRIAAVLLH